MVMTTSERARAALQPQNMATNDIERHLAELVRVLEDEWADLDAVAREMEDMKSIVFEEMCEAAITNGFAPNHNQAGRVVRLSAPWKDYVKRTVEARKIANRKRGEWRDRERDHWRAVRSENNERAQMRMVGR